MDERIDQDASRVSYELAYLLVPTLAEGDLETEAGNIKQIVTAQGGRVIVESPPVTTPLSYGMLRHVAGRNERFQDAYFGGLKFDIDPAQISTIKKALKDSPVVLRFMMVRARGIAQEKSIEKNTERQKEEITEEQTTAIDKSIEELVVE